MKRFSNQIFEVFNQPPTKHIYGAYPAPFLHVLSNCIVNQEYFVSGSLHIEMLLHEM